MNLRKDYTIIIKVHQYKQITERKNTTMMINLLTAENGGNSAILSIVMLVAMVALFYFFMYRPQKKQEKETKAMRDSLAIGDEITTIGGIIGKIVAIKDETVLIETGRDKVRIRILRGAVRNVDVKAEDAKSFLRIIFNSIE